MSYPGIKRNVLGKVDLTGMREVPWHKLAYGETYAIVGMFHMQHADGAFDACLRIAVTGSYQGQLAGAPDRHVFLDSLDGVRLVVSAPSFTAGITTSRVYKLRAARAKRAA